MKLVLRDPPLLVLMTAILLNLRVEKVDRQMQDRPPGWAARRLERFIAWRDHLSRRAG